MNAAQWHQEIVAKPADHQEQVITPSSNNISSSSKLANNSFSGTTGGVEKKAAGTVVRPPKEQPLPCPRCNSVNTKFCYYNNYSLTQPRYFCKGCRRYWTEGGSLRNIPVGGGSRKHKRSPSSAAPPPVVAAKKLFIHPSLQNLNPMIQQHQTDQRTGGHDLNLSFPNHHYQDFRSMTDFAHNLPNTSSQTAAAAATASSSHHSALELLTGMTTRGSVVGGGFSNTFMPISDPVYSSASFSNFMHDFKPPTLNFSLDNGLGIGPSGGGGFGNNDDQISTTGGGGRGRVSPSPYEDGMKNQQVDDHHHQQQSDLNRGHESASTGYWSGMLGGGGLSDW